MNRVLPLPERTMPLGSTSSGFADRALITKSLTGVSTSPIVKGIGPVVLFSSTLWSEIADTTGASLTGATFTVKLRLKVLFCVAPSLTVTVIKAVPLLLGAEVKERLPTVLGLAYVIIGSEIKPGLLEVAEIFSVWLSFAGPELIPARKIVCGPASSLMVKSLIGSSVGASFTAFTVTIKLRANDGLWLPPSFTVTVITAVPLA